MAKAGGHLVRPARRSPGSKTFRKGTKVTVNVFGYLRRGIVTEVHARRGNMLTTYVIKPKNQRVDGVVKVCTWVARVMTKGW